jgi:hypothetical protein
LARMTALSVRAATSARIWALGAGSAPGETGVSGPEWLMGWRVWGMAEGWSAKGCWWPWWTGWPHPVGRTGRSGRPALQECPAPARWPANSGRNCCLHPDSRDPAAGRQRRCMEGKMGRGRRWEWASGTGCSGFRRRVCSWIGVPFKGANGVLGALSGVSWVQSEPFGSAEGVGFHSFDCTTWGQWTRCCDIVPADPEGFHWLVPRQKTKPQKS